MFLQISIVNSSAILVTFFIKHSLIISSKRPEPKGSSTELAFLKFLEEICGMNYESVRKQYTITQKFPFNSLRKRMSCLIVDPNILGKKNRLVSKGASEILLEACTRFHSFQSDEILSMTLERRAEITSAIEKMASQALRTLILAYRDFEGPESFASFSLPSIFCQDIHEKDAKGVFSVEKDNLIFFGIVGIKDILRPEVPAAIETCKRAGIKVRMVTGDNKITARAIGSFPHLYFQLQ